MITLVFTYRNRSVAIVRKCLDSLAKQTNIGFEVILVNYGSTEDYSKQIASVLKGYDFVKYIHVKVEKQLWNKSRAINIALKKCQTEYFFVGDIDMIFKCDFIEKLNDLKSEKSITYFQVGFLSKAESEIDKNFQDYKIKHLTTSDATGMTLYPTMVLNSINGYDEFYHGWGAEDTDVHVRLKNAGYVVDFFDREILMLHQWHPRNYRSNKSLEPYCSKLESINHKYIQKVKEANLVKANTTFQWGEFQNEEIVNNLKTLEIKVSNQASEVDALLFGLLNDIKETYFIVEVEKHPDYKTVKNWIKRLIGKKYREFYNFQTVNDLILTHLVANYRNKYYQYQWHEKANRIQLKICL